MNRSITFTPRELEMIMPKLIARLPERFRWTAHNVVAHPLSEILFQIGLGDWGDRLHDCTAPTEED